MSKTQDSLYHPYRDLDRHTSILYGSATLHTMQMIDWVWESILYIWVRLQFIRWWLHGFSVFFFCLALTSHWLIFNALTKRNMMTHWVFSGLKWKLCISSSVEQFSLPNLSRFHSMLIYSPFSAGFLQRELFITLTVIEWCTCVCVCVTKWVRSNGKQIFWCCCDPRLGK